MGRRKLSPRNQKSRTITIEKRKKSLLRKAYELSTLCQVPVGVIIYTDDNQDSSNPAEIYPSNPVELRKILRRYMECSKGDRDYRAKNLVDIFTTKNGHLPRLLRTSGRDYNVVVGGGENDPVGPNNKYPGWVPGLDQLDRDGLVEVVSKLNEKIERVTSRIQFLKTQKLKDVRTLPRPPPLPPLQQPQSPLSRANLYGMGDEVNFAVDGSYKSQSNGLETVNFHSNLYQFTPSDGTVNQAIQPPLDDYQYNYYSQPDDNSPDRALLPFYETQAMQFQTGVSSSSSSSSRPSTSSIDQYSPSTPTVRQMMMGFMARESSSSNSVLPSSSVDPEASTPIMQRLGFMPYHNSTGFTMNDEEDGYFQMTNINTGLPPTTWPFASMMIPVPFPSLDSFSGVFCGNDAVADLDFETCGGKM